MQVVHNEIASALVGVRLTGGTSGAIVERNWIHGGAYGIDVLADGASDAEIRFNRIEATATGIDLVAAASGHIAGNDVDGGTTALNLGRHLYRD